MATPVDWRDRDANPPRTPFVLLYDVLACALFAVLLGIALTPGPLGQGLSAATLAAPAASALCLLLLLRCVLPGLCHSGLLEAEARILAACPGVAHDWASLTTEGGVQWQVHSLCVSGRARSSSSSSGAGGASARARQLPTLVVLHGHSCGAAHWEVLLRELGGHTDVWVLDLPGWGRSPAPRQLLEAPSHPRSAERISDLHTHMLAAWLRSKGLGNWGSSSSSSSSSASTSGAAAPAYTPLALLGHSMGGHVAACFAAAHPAVPAQLLLASPAGYLPMQPGSRTWRTTAVFTACPPQRIVRCLGRAATAPLLALLRAVYPEDNPHFASYYMQLAWATHATGAGDAVLGALFQGRRGCRALWARPFLPLLLGGGPGGPAAAAARRALPLAVLWGTGEELMPPVWGAAMHRLRPRTDLYLLRSGKHNSAHSHPEVFVEAVLAALRRGVGVDGGVQGGSGGGLLLRAAALHGTADAVVRQMGSGSGSLEEESAAVTVAAAPAAEGSSSSSSSEGAAAEGRRRGRAGSSGAGATAQLPEVQLVSSSRASSAGASSAVSASASAPSHLPPASAAAIGKCAQCSQAVAFHTTYWHCACGAWSFSLSLLADPFGWQDSAGMMAFLDELYLAHPRPFNAATCAHILDRHRFTPKGSAAAAAAAAAAALLPPAAALPAAALALPGQVQHFTPALMPKDSPRGHVYVLG